MNKEQIFKMLVKNIVNEVYIDDNINQRDIENIIDAVYCDKLHLLTDLRIEIEQNKDF
jgi:hypothetical protein